MPWWRALVVCVGVRVHVRVGCLVVWTVTDVLRRVAYYFSGVAWVLPDGVVCRG